jgi:hypothetical protein
MTLRATIALLAATLLGAPAPASLLGSWRAEQPLPNGIIQTFRFASDGGFDLTSSLAVDGTYHVDGQQLVQTIAVPGTSIPKADTTNIRVSGDSLVVSEPAAPGTQRVLRRASGSGTTIVGDWTIALSNGAVASYRFDTDGSLHVRAQVATEHGTYTVAGDTLRLSDEQTFQIPAVTRFSVADGVLTLTPPNGHGARRFRRVTP